MTYAKSNRKYIVYNYTYSRKGSRDISDIPPRHQIYLAMRNVADVNDDKQIAVWLQSISDVSADNSLVALYDIHERKGEVLFFWFVPDPTRDDTIYTREYIIIDKI
jgi:hypothetical protein